MMAFSRSQKILPALAALSLVAVPVMTWADASAPGIDKVYKKKPKAKPRPRAAVVRPARVAPQPVETVEAPPPVEAPAPVYEAPPAPAVAEAPPPPPAPAAPVETLRVAKKGNGTIIGFLAAAAITAGLFVAGSSSSSP
jgi:hypothetical protein